MDINNGALVVVVVVVVDFVVVIKLGEGRVVTSFLLVVFWLLLCFLLFCGSCFSCSVGVFGVVSSSSSGSRSIFVDANNADGTGGQRCRCHCGNG